MLEEMTLPEYRDWQRYYDADPWGEWRADSRQFVLLRHVLRAFEKHQLSELPHIHWPYYDPLQGDAPADLLSYVEAIDAALVAKPGGGYELTAPLEEVLARHGQ